MYKFIIVFMLLATLQSNAQYQRSSRPIDKEWKKNHPTKAPKRVIKESYQDSLQQFLQSNVRYGGVEGAVMIELNRNSYGFIRTDDTILSKEVIRTMNLWSKMHKQPYFKEPYYLPIIFKK